LFTSGDDFADLAWVEVIQVRHHLDVKTTLRLTHAKPHTQTDADETGGAYRGRLERQASGLGLSVRK